MKNEFTPELIEKARLAKSSAEIISLAKESGVELSEDEAAAVFAALHSQNDEMSDGELENVAGGSLDMGYRAFVTPIDHCSRWKCIHCKARINEHDEFICSDGYDLRQNNSAANRCSSCNWVTNFGVFMICNNPMRS